MRFILFTLLLSWSTGYAASIPPAAQKTDGIWLPASATDNEICTFNGTSGYKVDGGTATLSAGALAGLTSVAVDNISVNGNSITSTDTAGDINLTPDTTGDVVLDGQKWPQADGTAYQVPYTNGSAQLAYGNAHVVNTHSIELVGDDQAVTQALATMVILTSDDGTAANRTFTIADGTFIGQETLLFWNDTDEGQLVDTGTMVLTANWEPTDAGENLRLIWDGTNWVETSRIDIVPS